MGRRARLPPSPCQPAGPQSRPAQGDGVVLHWRLNVCIHRIAPPSSPTVTPEHPTQYGVPTESSSRWVTFAATFSQYSASLRSGGIVKPSPAIARSPLSVSVTKTEGTLITRSAEKRLVHAQHMRRARNGVSGVLARHYSHVRTGEHAKAVRRPAIDRRHLGGGLRPWNGRARCLTMFDSRGKPRQHAHAPNASNFAPEI